MSTTDVTLKLDIAGALSVRPRCLVELMQIPQQQEVKVSRLRAGQLIEQLMNQLYKSRDRYIYYKRGRTAKEIGELLGLDTQEVLALRREYRGQTWTKKECAEAFLKWFREDEKGRFPPQSKMNPVNGLPTINTLIKLFKSNNQQWLWRSDAYEQCVRATIKLMKPAEVLRIRNATWRRDAVEYFGIAAVLRHAEVVDDDPDHGRLLKTPRMDEVGSNDPHTLYLEVKNSTPEPDGTYAIYHLRVPPKMSCSKEARAWTFDISPWQTFQLGSET